jgi:hypothetical protein
VNASDYRTVCDYAGRRLARAHPWPVPARVPFPLNPQAAVYMACDASGACRNVGSVSRGPGSGLATRIAEHLGDPRKRAVWDHIWVLALHPDTPLAEVRRLEGVIGAHLGPVDNVRLPRPERRPRRTVVPTRTGSLSPTSSEPFIPPPTDDP